MGKPITSTRWISGSLTFCGRLARTRVTASLTSFSARSVLVSSANWMVVSESPSVIDEEMCRTPSTITDGLSLTTIQFALETNTDRALNDIKDAVTRVRANLPQNVTEPLIQRVDVI